MDSDRQNVINRLSRIEGQVKGIRKMIEEEQSCADVLVQIAAVKAAVSSVGSLVFQTHFRHCLERAIAERDADFIEEAMKMLSKYIV
ncbi:MAG: Copper-sensing transcriptional repressor RicR [Dehalococcoidia bacterium]|nr:Copper-sensing transcriptional repressor RicR [Bacillota bacterium]MBT9143730.1 Copper-sensing transcriptional repressor RicR [Bacillota bacterium]